MQVLKCVGYETNLYLELQVESIKHWDFNKLLKVVLTHDLESNHDQVDSLTFTLLYDYV
jgi:hypothetical protein